MPTVTFLGPLGFRRRRDKGESQWLRGVPVEVSQSWLDENRMHLRPRYFKIEGDEAPTVDEGNDGIPDKSWRVADIREWLGSKGLNPSGYATKRTLLQSVDEFLNPPAEVEEVIEEPALETQETGDDE